jgi:hypothetical protein
MRGQGSSKAAEITILLYITALRSGTINMKPTRKAVGFDIPASRKHNNSI